MDRPRESHMLTADQYNLLYCKAFARLDDIARQAEQAMRELEELQLSLGEEAPAAKVRSISSFRPSEPPAP